MACAFVAIAMAVASQPAAPLPVDVTINTMDVSPFFHTWKRSWGVSNERANLWVLHTHSLTA
jgi:hypothetical protein